LLVTGAGYWLLVAGCLLLVAGCGLLGASYWLLGSGLLDGFPFGFYVLNKFINFSP